MTIQSTVQVRCGHCGKSYEAEIYSAIDVSADPELKEKVRDGSVFLLECPHCGTKALGKGEMLYIDPEAKQFFSLVPAGFPGGSPEDPTGRYADYATRLVRTPGELIEKICIFDAGLDDAAVEMLKFVTAQDLGGEPEGTLRFLCLNGADNDLVFTFPSGGEMHTVSVGFSAYEDCAAMIRRNGDLLPKGLFPEINAAWIDSFMK